MGKRNDGDTQSPGGSQTPETRWSDEQISRDFKTIIGENGPEYGRMLPTGFIFFCFVVFATPMAHMIALGNDRTVQYWIGYWGLAAYVVPVVLTLGHVAHLSWGFPRKPVVLMCTLFPGVLFLIIGDIHLSVSYDLADQLFSTDCDTFESKRVLDRAWQSAHELYTGCLNRTVKSGKQKNLTMQSAYATYRVHHCEEYQDALRQHQAEWEYLRYAEETLHCSGWCYPDIQLWSYKHTRDSCSIATATTVKFTVQRLALQVVAYSVVVIVLTTIALVFLGPRIDQGARPRD